MAEAQGATRHVAVRASERVQRAPASCWAGLCGEEVDEARGVFTTNAVSTCKYNAFTFLPKNLFEQFRRIANFYFLVIIGLQNIPGLSPTDPTTSAVPLVVVLSITAIREAIEDYQRRKQDREQNTSTTHILRGDAFTDDQWENVRVGDILQVRKGETFPSDLILVHSPEAGGICFIETANLDGETNLKIRQSLADTNAALDAVSVLAGLDADIECPVPNNKLYEFNATLVLGGQHIQIGVQQLLLRGAVLRNTQFVYGLVIYTGRDTKLMQNATEAPSKQSRIEVSMNTKVILLFVVLGLFVIFSSIYAGLWLKYVGSYLSYLWATNDSSVKLGFSSLGTYLILLNTFIPISLYVTVEMVKVLQMFFINWDLEMYDPVSDTPAKARTSNLNEELGMVTTVFSDKTGTLTCNQMDFLKCTIGGTSYGRDGVPKFDDPALESDLRANTDHSERIRQFFTLLAVCHSVIPDIPDESDPDNIVYQASSPDEEALVKAARDQNFKFHTRGPSSVTISVFGVDEEYHILAVNEFNSDRKRMSVLVRCPDQRVRLYVKGADTMMLKLLGSTSPALMQATKLHLEQYSVVGLRTLVLAYRDVSENEYLDWNRRYVEATANILTRDQAKGEMAAQIETNLNLIGASGIEDKLQHGVPECIKALQSANIKVWVLTGDKQETAIEIGLSCNLLHRGMQLIKFNTNNKEQLALDIEAHLMQLSTNENPDIKSRAVIIDGETLTHALDDDLKVNFLCIAQMCISVVCCRVSPLQKALVVELVRNNLPGEVTLAIGDGANDVSMIQAAHIGIGISGKEGMQAVLSSDYAIAQFRFLRQLLLTHGRWSYMRICIVILFSFYKNFAFTLVMFWFSFYMGFSGQILFPSELITLYNVLFATLPIIVFGFTEQRVQPHTMAHFPKLYIPGQRNEKFTNAVFARWLIFGSIQSVVLYYVPYQLFSTVAHPDGKEAGLEVVGMSAFACVIVVVNLRVALETKHWTWLSHLAVWGTIGLFFLIVLPYSLLLTFLPNMYWVAMRMYATPNFYLAVLLSAVWCLMLDFGYAEYFRQFAPSAEDTILELEARYPDKLAELVRAQQEDPEPAA